MHFKRSKLTLENLSGIFPDYRKNIPEFSGFWGWNSGFSGFASGNPDKIQKFILNKYNFSLGIAVRFPYGEFHVRTTAPETEKVQIG
jgi:hypothetical protein